MISDSVMSANEIVQYSIVGVILLVVCLWLIMKVTRKNNKNSGGCCGCAIAEKCKKKDLKK